MNRQILNTLFVNEVFLTLKRDATDEELLSASNFIENKNPSTFEQLRIELEEWRNSEFKVCALCKDYILAKKALTYDGALENEVFCCSECLVEYLQ